MTSPHPKENINSYYINQIKGYAIFTTDKNGFITSWNEGAERLKGYSEEEIIGQYYGILHTDENQKEKKPQKEMEEAINQGTYEGEGWRKRKDGSLFWATVTLTPIYSD